MKKTTKKSSKEAANKTKKHLVVLHYNGEIFPYLIESNKTAETIKKEFIDLKEKIAKENMDFDEFDSLIQKKYNDQPVELLEVWLE